MGHFLPHAPAAIAASHFAVRLLILKWQRFGLARATAGFWEVVLLILSELNLCFKKSHHAVVAREAGDAVALLIAGAVLAAWHLFVTQPAWFTDSDEYLYVAELLRGTASLQVAGLGPVYYREIGYPLLLAVLGVQRHGLLPLWLAQWAAAAVTPALFYSSLVPWTRYAALLAWLYLTSFAAVLNAHSALRDTGLNFMIAALLLGFSLLVQHRSPLRWAFFIGTSLVSVVLKESLILAVAPLTVFIWISSPTRRTAAASLWCLALLGGAVAVSSSQFENHSITGRLTFWQVWGVGYRFSGEPIDLTSPCLSTLMETGSSEPNPVILDRKNPTLYDWYRLWAKVDANLTPDVADRTFLCAAGEIVASQPVRLLAYAGSLLDVLVMPDVSYVPGKRMVSWVPLEVQSDYRGLPELISKEIGESLERSRAPEWLTKLHWNALSRLLWLARIAALGAMLALLPRVVSMKRERRALALGGFGVFIFSSLTIVAFSSAGGRLTSTLLLPMAFTVGICLTGLSVPPAARARADEVIK